MSDVPERPEYFTEAIPVPYMQFVLRMPTISEHGLPDLLPDGVSQRSALPPSRPSVCLFPSAKRKAVFFFYLRAVLAMFI